MTHKPRRSVTARKRTKRDVASVLRSIENIHRLVRIRNAAPNMAAVRAIRLLEDMDSGSKAQRKIDASPGITICIVSQTTGGGKI